MYHSFLIHSFVDGHLGCFQHLAIINCAAVNIEVHRFFWIGVSGFLGYSPSGGIAGSQGSSIFSFQRKFHTILHSACSSLHSHQQWTRVPFSPPLCQHVLFLDLFMMAILTGVKRYLIVVLICISLMANDAEHPFICLWALCMSSLEKCLCRSFAHFLNWVVCLPGVESCEDFTYFGDQTLVWGIIGKYIFPPTCFPFHFANVFFSHAEAFYFDEAPFVNSFLYVPCSRGHISENVAAWNIWNFPAFVFLYRTFIVSQLIFKSFLHLEFIVVYGISWWSSFIFSHVQSSSPNTIYWRGCFYSIVCSCPLVKY